jgi:predicted peptidase
MKKISFVIFLLIFSGATAFSQDLALYEKHLLIQNMDTLPYRLLLPENYDAKKKYPLVFFMHGAGERGNDNEIQLLHGGKLFLADGIRKSFPAIVVFPQCPRNSFWSAVNMKTDKAGKRQFNFNKTTAPTIAMKMASDLLRQVIKKYPVQKKKVYVAGLSMGGMGTFEMAARYPKLFAAAVPICGGGDPTTAKSIRKINWWVFHGAKDDVVPPFYSETMVNALKVVKADVKFTLYPDANHNSWDPAFAEPGLLPWLFAQKK